MDERAGLHLKGVDGEVTGYVVRELAPQLPTGGDES